MTEGMIKYLTESALFLVLIIVDAIFFWITVYTLVNVPEFPAAIGVLLGTIIGAITTAIGLAAKDYWGKKETPENK